LLDAIIEQDEKLGFTWSLNNIEIMFRTLRRAWFGFVLELDEVYLQIRKPHDHTCGGGERDDFVFALPA